jgi:phosphoribosylglycinamide formyltransferase-1
MSASAQPYQIAVLVSGSGSNLQALLDAQQAGDLGDAEIVLVVSDRADAYGLPARSEAPRRRSLHPAASTRAILLRAPPGNAAWQTLLPHLRQTMIVLAGFMRVLSPVFLDRFPNRVINHIRRCSRDDRRRHLCHIARHRYSGAPWRTRRC